MEGRVKELLMVAFVVCSATPVLTQESQAQSSNLKQYYSGKFGFYQPGDGLNNGLVLGVDGITEFLHYHFFIGGAIDLYPKQTFDFFTGPSKPRDVVQQSIILVPLHVNAGYQFFDIPNADSRGYIGAGFGYYFYFYNVEYRTGGGILGGFTNTTESKNGGALFATAFVRALIGKVFVEPRLYFAQKTADSVGGYSYVVNPSGFAITIGFQY